MTKELTEQLGYEGVLQKAKIDINDFTLRTHHIYSIKSLNSLINNGSKATRFYDHVADLYSEQYPLLLRALNPLENGTGDNYPNNLPPSLFKLFLSVSYLLPKILEFLLDTYEQYTTNQEENEENDTPTTDNNPKKSRQAQNFNESIPKLILHHLKYIDFLTDENLLAFNNQLIDVVDNITSSKGSGESAVDLILAIPEIITAEGKASLDIMECLLKVLDKDPKFMNCTLETLGRLNVNSNDLKKIQNNIIKKLESADPDSLPVILRFILQLVDNDNVVEVAKAIRNYLDFKALATILNDQAAKPSSRGVVIKDLTKTSEVDILESFKVGLRVNKCIMDALLTLIEQIQEPAELYHIDLLFLIIISSPTTSFSKQLRKKTFNTFKKLIQSGVLTPAFVNQVFNLHKLGLKDYYDQNVLFIIEELMIWCCDDEGSSGYKKINVCQELYCSAFTIFDVGNKQDIIGSLVTHVGSGQPKEITVSLTILHSIALLDPKGVCLFSHFITTCRDYLDKLNMNQIRILFEIFGIMVVKGDGATDLQASDLLSELLIYVRKRLAFEDVKSKKIGVVACTCLFKYLVLEGSNPNQTNNDALIKQAIEILGIVLDNCKNNMSCLILVFDDLSLFISTFHSSGYKICDSIFDSLVDRIIVHFGDIYVRTTEEVEKLKLIQSGELVDKDRALQGFDLSYGYSLEYKLALQEDKEDEEEDDDEEDEDGDNWVLVYPITPFFSTDNPSRVTSFETSSEKIVLLPSFFRLLATQNLYREGDVEDIGSCLISGVVLFDKISEEDQTLHDKERLCSSLFFTINYFRELINIFSKDLSNKQNIFYVIQRIKHVQELEDRLLHLCKIVPTWTPFGYYDLMVKSTKRKHATIEAVEESESIFVSDLFFVEPEVEKESARKKAKSRSATPLSTKTSDTEEIEKKVATKGKGKSAALPVSRITCLTDIQMISREFDMHVFHIIGSEDFEEVLVDTNLNDIDNKKIDKIQYPEIKYLLQDLQTKLEYKLGSNKSKKGQTVVFDKLSLMTGLEVIEKSIELAPVLCKIFERIVNDRITDLSTEDSNDSTLEFEDDSRLDCLKLTVECFLLMFGSNLMESKTMFVKLASFVAARGASGGIQDPLQGSFEYFHRHSKILSCFTLSIHFLNLLELIHAQTPVADSIGISKKIHTLAGVFLRHDWKEKRLKVDNLAYLLKTHIEYGTNKAVILNRYVSSVLLAFAQRNEEILSENPFLDSETYEVYFKTIFDQLVKVTTEYFRDNVGSVRLADLQENEVDTILLNLEYFVVLFSKMISNNKQLHMKNPKNLHLIILRQGKLFLDLFSKYKVFGVLGPCFKQKKEVWDRILKAFQHATRSLQAFCNDMKVSKESVLISLVPVFKRTLETIFFEVKNLCEQNGVLKAFWVGNLKQKNFLGQNVSSQMPRDSESEIDDDDEDNKIEQLSEVDGKDKSKKKKVEKKKPLLPTEGKKLKSKNKKKKIISDEDDNLLDVASDQEETSPKKKRSAVVLYSDEEKLSEKEVKHQRKKSKTSTKSSACKTKKSSLPPKHTNSKKKLKPEVSKKTLKKKSEIFVKDTEMDEVDELEGEEYDESEEELLLKSKLSKAIISDSDDEEEFDDETDDDDPRKKGEDLTTMFTEDEEEVESD